MRLKIVESISEYWQFIREVRFHPRNICGFVHNDPITIEQQNKYMRKYSSGYWICVSEKIPVGFIGVVLEDLRIGVHPDYQRKGVGTFMMNFLIQKGINFNIRVKVDNAGSLKFFSKLGFIPEFYTLKKKI